MTYSSSLAIGRGRFAARNQNEISFNNKHSGKLGPVSNTIILIILACILGLLYLTQVTKTNSYGYRINELETRESQLLSEHDELEVAAARLQALERVQNSEINKNLVTVAPSGTVQN